MYSVYVQNNFSPIGVLSMMIYLNERMLHIRIHLLEQSQGIIWAIFSVFLNNFS